MRNFILILMLILPVSAIAQNSAGHQSVAANKGTLIREIKMDGFVLGDRDRFVKLFKTYRNKYLTPDDMDAILQKIKDIYEREGYLELVSISYKVIKHRLVYTVLMTS